MELINRQSYLDRVNQWFGKHTILVLTGQRRVGKSCLLKQVASQVASQGNVIFIDKEKHEFEAIRSYQDLNAFIDSHRKKGAKNFILIDEVQDIAGFEHSLRSFYSEDDCEIVVTGSNARMLSSELTTLIGGRYKEIYIQPLDYSEFLNFHRLQDSDSALASYIEFGGMPGIVNLGLDPEITREYLRDIYSTTLLKDVVMRNQVRNVVFLDSLVRFLADNEGKLISANNISKFMKSRGDSLSPSIVINYLKMLTDSYMVSRVNRFDIHGRRIFESNDKFYFEDHGLRNAIAGGTREGDIEKVLESIVYQHLVRMGYRVFVGELQAGEIDFVCETPRGARIYVQVCYIIVDEQTREREFGALRKINDNYPKFVISMSPLLTRNDANGITHLHLRHFLTSGFGAEF